MGLFGFGSELIDIVEWLDDSANTMVYRFQRPKNEIKNGAQLVVRESQQAVFVDQGQFADVFHPGTHILSTANLPILSTLKGWKHGFNSPFKSEVYFVNTKNFTDLKWGTPKPVMMRDSDFGAVRIRAFGSYTIRVVDAKKFLQEIVGTDGHFQTEEIADQLRDFIVSRFSDVVAESGLAVLDLAANYNELSERLEARMQTDFTEYGLELNKFMIGNISLPDEVEAALDKRSSMGMIGNMQAFNQYQTGIATEKMAGNPTGGAASEGMGMGMGFAMASNMMNANQAGGQAPQVPPPPPVQEQYFVHHNGQQQGPYEAGAIQNMLSQHQLADTTLAWKQGMAGWEALSTFPEFRRSTPPPMPPPPPQV